MLEFSHSLGRRRSLVEDLGNAGVSSCLGVLPSPFGGAQLAACMYCVRRIGCMRSADRWIHSDDHQWARIDCAAEAKRSPVSGTSEWQGRLMPAANHVLEHGLKNSDNKKAPEIRGLIDYLAERGGHSGTCPSPLNLRKLHKPRCVLDCVPQLCVTLPVGVNPRFFPVPTSATRSHSLPG